MKANDLNEIFFDLIRVSLGAQGCLSRTPSAEEWHELYAMAKKQSILGICFVGVQRLKRNEQQPDELLYIKWMGMAAKIQRKNEKMNARCVELQEMLEKDGLRSCILKGQGVATLYNVRFEPGKLTYVGDLRQSGDIDVWVDAPKQKVVSWAENVGMEGSAGYLHVGVRCFEDTDVEVHYRPTYMRSIRHNRRLQDFCEAHKNDWVQTGGMTVPSYEFNIVYQLSHIYRHLFGMGVGMRQLMDYYFVLRTSYENKKDNEKLRESLRSIGLLKFAGAVMYVMYEVFGMKVEDLICPVDMNRGKMLLEMIMQTGNFGKMDKKQKEARKTTSGSLMYKLQQWWKLVWLYPEETLSAPLWSIVRKLD